MRGDVLSQLCALCFRWSGDVCLCRNFHVCLPFFVKSQTLKARVFTCFTANGHIDFKKWTICKEICILHKNSRTVPLPHSLWGIQKARTCFLKLLQSIQLHYVDHFSSGLQPSIQDRRRCTFEGGPWFSSCSRQQNYLGAGDLFQCVWGGTQKSVFLEKLLWWIEFRFHRLSYMS